MSLYYSLSVVVAIVTVAAVAVAVPVVGRVVQVSRWLRSPLLMKIEMSYC